MVREMKMETPRPRAAPRRSSVPGLRNPLMLKAGGLLVFLILSPLRAQEPVHVLIDKATDAARTGPAVPVADDATFQRRAALVFTGMPPSAEEARAFCKDTAPDKRTALVTRLSAAPAFTRHLAVQLDVMLMERRPEMHTKAADWRLWLEKSLETNKPWDQIVKEMLAADGSDANTRAVARWLLERQSEPNLLTRDAGRLFLGRDMACAQCHDHPRIDDYLQRDYHGLYAFFGRTSLFQPDPNKPAFVAEQAAGDAAFTSVFTKVSGNARPHLPGDRDIEEPAIPEDQQWTVAPNAKDKNVRPVPKYSRRTSFAGSMVKSSAFRRNIGNRLWGMVMGRCLVEPPDIMHSGNPPAHPAVLDAVADGIAAMKYDMRGFMRELALTKTFAQAFDPAPLPPDVQQSLAQKLPSLEAEAARLKEEASKLAVTFTEHTEAMEELQRSTEPVIAEWTKADAASAAAKSAHAAALAAVQKAEDAKKPLTETLRTLTEAAQAAEKVCAAAPQDKELAAALKTYKDKTAGTQSSSAAADKEIAAKQADAKTKEAAATAAAQTALSKKAPADEAKQKVATAMQNVAQDDKAKQAARVAANEAALRVKESQAMVAYVNAVAAATPLLAECEKQTAALRAAEKEIAPQEIALSHAKHSLSAAEQAAGDAAAQVTSAKKAAETAKARMEALRDASDKTVLAIQKLPGDKELEGAGKTLQTKFEAAAKESEAKAKSVTDAESASSKAAAKVTELKELFTKAEAARAAVEPKLAPFKAAVADAESKASTVRLALADARQALAAVQTGTSSVAGLTSLTPEQFCWSVFQATGIMDQMKEQSAKEWDAKNKPSDADKADPAKQAARAAGIDQLTFDKIKPHQDQFVRLFGNSAGQPQSDFFATADQALYFENAGQLRSWTYPSGDNLAGRLLKLKDPQAIAEELYLSTLTRMPDAEEVSDIARFFDSRPPDQRAAAASDAVWALVTSLEFRFRH
jgi:hypothetical protein